MSFSLVTYREDGEIRLGILRHPQGQLDGSSAGRGQAADRSQAGGGLLAPPELKRWASMTELLDAWPEAAGLLASLDLTSAPRVETGELLAPITYPRKVLCAGVNYRKHIREMGGAVPGAGWEPFFFFKPPSTTVTGPADPIVIRDHERAQYDWEAELAVVIGTGGRDIPASRALDHVAGYCVANDVTARGYHRRAVAPAEAFRYDWAAAKAADTSLPMGPGITPAFLVPDPQDLRLRLWVNDELQQDESTADMICGVAELIATASRYVTLEPGDVIATGTPSGVGAARGLFLKHGDVVTVAIDGLGQISNRVVDAERSQQ
jgi:2-keto-4-pentenoate hydratase/2-oxohepta-3-ene-1,7-dioic acid hydratase in catechol pathway